MTDQRDVEICRLQGEVQQLRMQLADHGETITRLEAELYAVLTERNVQAVEIERLRAENKRLRGWIAPDILELTDEIERLRADKDVQRSQDRNAAYEADIERLRSLVKDLVANQGELGTEIKRLRRTSDE